MKFKEIETKYDATEINLTAFKRLAQRLKPVSEKHVGSLDHYFTRSDGLALRYREGTRPELTVKQKSSDRNNFIRTEVNLPIRDVPLEMIAAFAQVQGYEHDFTIYKDCAIYFWDKHNVVHYTVKSTNGERLGAFMEIELNESVAWESDEAAWVYLREIEKEFEPLGITPARRLRRSLLEMFRRK
jgi:adenylate cyclase class IV